MEKNIFIKMVFLLLGILFISSCGDSSDSLSDLLLTKDNNGQTVEIGIDNKIVIELESNPSTGYRWEHANPDGSFIYQDEDSTFILDPDCNGADGCGGIERLTFRAGEIGDGVISLVYHRTFEEEPSEQFSINVNVL